MTIESDQIAGILNNGQLVTLLECLQTVINMGYGNVTICINDHKINYITMNISYDVRRNIENKLAS